jgi:predicted MFS family arabinose efflux permease
MVRVAHRLCSAVVRNPFESVLWRNSAFRRVWAASTVSVFGSLVTRIALPLVAILVLGAGPVEMSILRSLDLIAALVFGLVAGAWVDRLRRRPVLIWADLGRAVLLGSIPVAFALGVLTFPHLLVVTGIAAVLTVFFDSADNAYLPTVVEREQLTDANAALSASGSASEVLAFGLGGVLVQVLTAPVTIAIDAVTFLVSAVLLGTIRKEEAPPPPRADRSPVIDEIRDGIRLVRHDPILRAFAGSQVAISMIWGIFGTTWWLFTVDELGLGPGALGVVAAVGGVSSLVGALITGPVTRRWGVGPVVIAALVLSTISNLFVPLAPVGAPLVAITFLVLAQLLGDSSLQVYDISEVVVRQTLVDDRALGRVSSTFVVASGIAQLITTLLAGVLAVAIGLRATMWITPLFGAIGVLILWFSPVRQLQQLPVVLDAGTVGAVEEIERDRPIGG